ncbi:MAG: DNA polymerase III subunit gamma/tau [Candidatus Berkelbacteria bacterium]|nr:DNA polymerase III subunit gamma/tau [Candidatus Berkelbacteria bacterium]MCR4307206.1 DNA polymerase III subunit gamma/tau [Candidatus Berkelbacteria bacterium]
MSSLYRKYRPNQFSELVGQDHIRGSIEAMLKSNQIGHAYLFSGPRGTGKTTLARLLARAVNCVGKKKGVEACGVCEICLEIQNGQSVDVMEIDAASNRGIDDIRELREKITFAPTRSKYRVYIIDEVHMLSKDAFNALLKTLEEPPAHAIFILATTELHKVPETIISRCLRYQFHRATPDKIVSILKEIAVKEGIKLEDDAAQLLAERAEGSYRDALSLLGNVSGEKDLNAANLRVLIGLPSAEVVSQLLSAVANGKPQVVASLLKGFVQEGLDVGVLVRSMANSCREQIFSSQGADVGVAAPLLEELLVALAKARQSIDATSLLCASLISASLARVSTGSQEASLVVTNEPSSSSVTDLSEKELPSAPAVDTVSATPVKVDDTGAFWPSFLAAVHEKNHALYAVVSSANFEGLTDDKLIIAVKFRFYSERLFEPKNRNLIETIASSITGRKLVLECLVKADLDSGTNKEEDLLSTVVEVFEINE